MMEKYVRKDQKGYEKNIQTIVMEIPLWLLFVFDLVVSLDSGKIIFFLST